MWELLYAYPTTPLASELSYCRTSRETLDIITSVVAKYLHISTARFSVQTTVYLDRSRLATDHTHDRRNGTIFPSPVLGNSHDPQQHLRIHTKYPGRGVSKKIENGFIISISISINLLRPHNDNPLNLNLSHHNPLHHHHNHHQSPRNNPRPNRSPRRRPRHPLLSRRLPRL
jgi:hypothetical protein